MFSWGYGFRKVTKEINGNKSGIKISVKSN